MPESNGTIPLGRRRLAMAVLVIASVVLMGAIAVISAIFDLPVHWGWLLGAVVVVAVLIGSYLWVRLADEE